MPDETPSNRQPYVKHKAKSFCVCWTRKCGPYSWKNCGNCLCGEETELREWVWEHPSPNSTSWVLLTIDRTQATFHPFYSSGTAAVKGTTPMIHNYHYYWEVKMLTDTYGTDIMVGVGSEKMDIHDPQYKFTSLIGLNEESYGLSYTGAVRHNAQVTKDSNGFCRGTIIGVKLDMWLGTLEFYVNREPQGIAFYNLRRHNMLFPMLSSTAAQSAMRLIHASSWKACLLVDAARILASAVNDKVVERPKLPPGLWKILRRHFWMTLPSGCEDDEPKPGFVAASPMMTPVIWYEDEALYVKKRKPVPKVDEGEQVIMIGLPPRFYKRSTAKSEVKSFDDCFLKLAF